MTWSASKLMRYELRSTNEIDLEMPVAKIILPQCRRFMYGQIMRYLCHNNDLIGDTVIATSRVHDLKYNIRIHNTYYTK